MLSVKEEIKSIADRIAAREGKDVFSLTEAHRIAGIGINSIHPFLTSAGVTVRKFGNKKFVTAEGIATAICHNRIASHDNTTRAAIRSRRSRTARAMERSNNMNTGDRKTFTMDLPDIGVKRDVEFIFIKGIGWVADRNTRTGISYNEIEKCGYVTSKEVTFDFGDRVEVYKCRILTSTEWDDCMDYDDSNDTWHWENEFSWVRSIELERAKSSIRAIRGYYSARYWNYNTASDTLTFRGWRPCLEVLESDTLIPDVESGS